MNLYNKYYWPDSSEFNKSWDIIENKELLPEDSQLETRRLSGMKILHSDFTLNCGLIINTRSILQSKLSIFDFKIQPRIKNLKENQVQLKLLLCTKKRTSFLLNNHIEIISSGSIISEWFRTYDGINPLMDNLPTNDIYLEISYPQTEIIFTKNQIQPVEILVDEVNIALKHINPYQNLMKVFAKYGYFIAQKITIGQKLYRKLLLENPIDQLGGCKISDGVYDLINNNGEPKTVKDELILCENLMKKYNFDMTYFMSTNGNVVQKDNLDKWIESCSYEPPQVISKDGLFPIYEIFDEQTIKRIKSVIGIRNIDLRHAVVSEYKLLMTGIIQIQDVDKCHRIKFAKPLESNNYQIFGNVVECNEEQQKIEDVIVKFELKSKHGFSIKVQHLGNNINGKEVELQVIWMLIGIPADIGFYSLNTREILILYRYESQVTISNSNCNIKPTIIENLPQDSIMVTSIECPLSNFEPLFTVKANYIENKINWNVVNFDLNDKNNSEKKYSLQWCIFTSEKKCIEADVYTQTCKLINLSSIGAPIKLLLDD
ncbi:36898_t:CDS:2 [Gigaspora margarita]|uniref:36898_t:CDS:1 n=1 Tax=Gigaspora margarita TaxID=4874 RepID=A0ABN7WD81_GIGMA|nr:36898_t:CDS:2 [Gigaspora margarita]